jgi:uncharacterized membrane protein YccC
MKSFKEITGFNKFIYCEYNLKCLVGVGVGYLLYKAFPEEGGQLLWLLLSILLSITHDNSSKVAYDRMKGNVVGSLIGLFAYFLHDPPNLLTISVGVAATITVCWLLRLVDVTRTALVALVIVVLYEEAHSSWAGAVYRMLSVVVGCFIGLVINFVFRRIAVAMYSGISAPAEGQGEHDGGE